MPEDKAARFDKAVDAFLQSQQLANVGEIVSKNLTGNFLADPIIGAYLTRPASEISFDAKGEPLLQSSHEREFYDSCRQNVKTFIPYRAEKGSLPGVMGGAPITSFYISGTYDQTMPVFNRMLHRQTQDHTADSDAHVFLVTNAYDTYQTSGVLRRFQGEKAQYDYLGGKLEDAFGKEIALPKNGISFLIFPSGRDGHAITFFAVLDNAAKKVIRTGLCNSWANPLYTKQVWKRMNMDVDPEYAPEIKPFQLVDCSQHIQTSDDDLNCGLYRHNFATALVQMLQHDAGMRHAMADPDISEEALAEKVKNGMKSHLPQYYQRDGADFTKVSEDQKRQVHLETRWEVGNAFLRDKIAEFKQVGKAKIF